MSRVFARYKKRENLMYRYDTNLNFAVMYGDDLNSSAYRLSFDEFSKLSNKEMKKYLDIQKIRLLSLIHLPITIFNKAEIENAIKTNRIKSYCYCFVGRSGENINICADGDETQLKRLAKRLIATKPIYISVRIQNFDGYLDLI